MSNTSGGNGTNGTMAVTQRELIQTIAETNRDIGVAIQKLEVKMMSGFNEQERHTSGLAERIARIEGKLEADQSSRQDAGINRGHWLTTIYLILVGISSVASIAVTVVLHATGKA